MKFWTQSKPGSHEGVTKGFPLSRPHNWLIFKVVNSALLEVFREYAKGRLIDIGCGTKPYTNMLAPYVTEHIGLDHAESPHPLGQENLIGSAYEVPQPGMSFDTLLCTDVLEHLEEPLRAVTEANRLLKPGGHAIYTVPLFWHLHEEPRDFFRYTRYGLEYLFKKANFEIISITPLSGFIVSFSQEFCYYIQFLRKGGPLNPLWWIVPAFSWFVQRLAYALNQIDRSHRFTVEYLAVVRKKSGTE